SLSSTTQKVISGNQPSSSSTLTDLFLYNQSSGTSYVEDANGSGGWNGVSGPTFSKGWSVYTGNFNSDAYTDLFLYNATTARTSYVEMSNGNGGWSGVVGPTFSTGWKVYPGSYNNDAYTDL